MGTKYDTDLDEENRHDICHAGFDSVGKGLVFLQVNGAGKTIERLCYSRGETIQNIGLDQHRGGFEADGQNR